MSLFPTEIDISEVIENHVFKSCSSLHTVIAPKDQVLFFGNQAVDLSSSSFRKLNRLSKDYFHASRFTVNINMSVEELDRIFQALGLLDCELVCYNTVIFNVVGGPIDRFEKLERQVAKNNIETISSQLTFASHSAQMDPNLEGLREVVNQIPFRRPRIAIASTVESRIVENEGTFNADHIIRILEKTCEFRMFWTN